MSSKLNSSRRRFLQNTAAYSLALPMLQGLIPRQAFAQAGTTPKRLVVFYTLNGVKPAVYWPATTGNIALPAQYMSYSPLSDFGSSLSPYFGSIFSAVQSKMNIYHGLDLQMASIGHNRTYALSCTSQIDKYSGPVSGKTIDNVLAQSKTMYPTQPEFDALRIQVSAGPPPEAYSWDRDALGNSIKMSILATDKALYDYVFTSRGLTGTDAASFDAIKTRNVGLLNALNTQYSRFKANPALSSEGQNRLAFHMDLLHNLTQRVQSSVFSACSAPNITPAKIYPPSAVTQADRWNQARNVNDTIISAFNCDLTRVALVSYTGLWNVHWHSDPNDPIAQQNWMAWNVNHAKAIADFVGKMDQIVEANGKTMLDNSLVVWANEFGLGGAAHSPKCLATVTFGSAQGKLKTGYFMDFESRLYNQFNATVMQAMGLQESDYVGLGDGNGYGEYNPASIYPNVVAARQLLYTKFLPERSKPLPWVYTG